MAGVLLKIAKEFNVATTTIVDFLTSKGFAIENKPNAKLSDEMYNALSIEYKGSAADKEKADQIQIGTSYKKAEDKQVPKAPPPPPVKEIVKAIDPIPGVVVEEVKPTPPPPPVEEIVIEVKQDAPKLKVLGKIDLEPKKKSTPKKTEQTSKEPEKPAKKEV
ncbi:MAG: hypothetical protein RLZZ546_1576, partial [Bacteroidota bacterium]